MKDSYLEKKPIFRGLGNTRENGDLQKGINADNRIRRLERDYEIWE